MFQTKCSSSDVVDSENIWNTRNGPAWRLRLFNHMNIPSIGADSTKSAPWLSEPDLSLLFLKVFLMQFYSACQIQKTTKFYWQYIFTSHRTSRKNKKAVTTSRMYWTLKNFSLLSVCVTTGRPNLTKSHLPFLDHIKGLGQKAGISPPTSTPAMAWSRLVCLKNQQIPRIFSKKLQFPNLMAVAYPFTYPILDCTGFFRSTFGPGLCRVPLSKQYFSWRFKQTQGRR